MHVQLTQSQIALLKEPHIGFVVTLMKDGSPQVTPVWLDTDGRHVLVNTAEGRVKTRNLRRDPRVAVSVVDADQPYSRVLNIAGKAVEITTEGAEDHIDALSKRYTGRFPYPSHDPNHPRLIVKILPEKISGR